VDGGSWLMKLSEYTRRNYVIKHKAEYDMKSFNDF